MPTRNVIVDIIEQTAGARTVVFNSHETVAVDAEVLTTKDWKFTTNANGTPITVALPVPTTGSIRWDYQLPAKAGYRGKGYFFLSLGDGSDVTLSSLVAAPGPATDALVDYIDTLLASSEHSSTGAITSDKNNFNHTYDVDSTGASYTETNQKLITNVDAPANLASVNNIRSIVNQSGGSVGQLNGVRSEIHLSGGANGISNGIYAIAATSGSGFYGQVSGMKVAVSTNGGEMQDLYGLQIDMNNNAGGGIIPTGYRAHIYLKNGQMLWGPTDPTRDFAIYSKVDRVSEFVGGLDLNSSTFHGSYGNTSKVLLKGRMATAQTHNPIELYKDAAVNPSFAIDKDGKRVADPTMTMFGLPSDMLKGLEIINVRHVFAGLDDFYTVPPGKKAILFTSQFANPTGGSIARTHYVKIGGIYYRIATTAATSAGASSNVTFAYVCHAGESFAANFGGGTAHAVIWLFPDTTKFKTVRINNLGLADTELYTVPAGKMATFFNTDQFVGGSPWTRITNDSGASATIQVYVLPTGGIVEAANQILSATVAAASQNAGQIPVMMTAGMKIMAKSSTANAGQHLWATLYEADA